MSLETLSDTPIRSNDQHLPLDVISRIDQFRQMRDGWLDGAGLAPPSAGLDWLANQLKVCKVEEIPVPYLYPTPTGGVRLEWSLPPHEATLEIDLHTHVAEWHALDVDTEADESRTLHLDTEADAKWWRECVRSLESNAA